MVLGMNECGVVSVKALSEALPFKTLQYLAIFGSQVRGDARPDSDLDVLVVSRNDLCDTIRNIILEAPGGVKTTTIISHTPETIREPSNVYGYIEYHALRGEGAHTLYRSADFDVQLHTEVNYEYSAKRWLELATQRLSSHTLDSQYGSTCCKMHAVIWFLLRSLLVSNHILFPYDTRDIRELYELLPSRPPLDVDKVVGWRDYLKDFDNTKWSKRDAQDAMTMANQTCSYVTNTLRNVI
jgi:hypothetical protein